MSTVGLQCRQHLAQYVHRIVSAYSPKYHDTVVSLSIPSLANRNRSRTASTSAHLATKMNWLVHVPLPAHGLLPKCHTSFNEYVCWQQMQLKRNGGYKEWTTVRIVFPSITICMLKGTDHSNLIIDGTQCKWHRSSDFMLISRRRLSLPHVGQFIHLTTSVHIEQLPGQMTAQHVGTTLSMIMNNPHLVDNTSGQ